MASFLMRLPKHTTKKGIRAIFCDIMENLPTDLPKLLFTYLDEDSFRNFRVTSKKYADLSFHHDTLHARGMFFVIKNRRDLPAFSQMMEERSLYNIPIEIKDKQITDKELVYLERATSVNLARCRQITDEGLKKLAHATTVDLSFCCKITDVGLEKLIHATLVYLNGCTQTRTRASKTSHIRRGGI